MDNQVSHPQPERRQGTWALLGMAIRPVCCKVEYVEDGSGKIVTDYDQGL